MNIPLYDVTDACFRRRYTIPIVPNVLTPRSLTDGRRLVHLSFSFFASFFTNLVIFILHTCLIYSTIGRGNRPDATVEKIETKYCRILLLGIYPT